MFGQGLPTDKTTWENSCSGRGSSYICTWYLFATKLWETMDQKK